MKTNPIKVESDKYVLKPTDIKEVAKKDDIKEGSASFKKDTYVKVEPKKKDHPSLKQIKRFDEKPGMK